MNHILSQCQQKVEEENGFFFFLKSGIKKGQTTIRTGLFGDQPKSTYLIRTVRVNLGIGFPGM